MAVNRVVLQHMTLNLLEEDIPARDENDEDATAGNAVAGGETGNDEDAENKAPAAPTAATDLEQSGQVDPTFLEVRKSPFGLSPPSESLLMQRRKLQSQSLQLNCSRRPYMTAPSCC